LPRSILPSRSTCSLVLVFRRSPRSQTQIDNRCAEAQLSPLLGIT
jgi:hypothetical protein